MLTTRGGALREPFQRRLHQERPILLLQATDSLEQPSRQTNLLNYLNAYSNSSTGR